jgi:hypothetical protein
MIVYRVYNEQGGYVEYTEEPQGVEFEIIDKTPTIQEIEEQELEQQKLLKQQQYEELLLTDWYVVRFVEKGVEIPEEILKQRQEIRNKYK